MRAQKILKDRYHTKYRLHKWMKVKTNNRGKTGKLTKLRKLNSILLNQWTKEEIARKLENT